MYILDRCPADNELINRKMRLFSSLPHFLNFMEFGNLATLLPSLFSSGRQAVVSMQNES